MGFKVGDKVKILNTEFGNKDKIGTITNISGSVMIYFVEIEGDYGHVCQWSNASDLELVTEEEKVMKFKVGDRVQVVATYSGFYGDKGNVTENDGTDNLPVRVRFDDGEHVCWFYEDDLKVLHEEEKVMEFKVGDKVRMIRNTYGNRGKIGTLEKIDTSAMPYCVVFDDGRKEWCYGNEFKLLMGETSVKFKVGDRVRIGVSCMNNNGKEGVISEVDGSSIPYNVTLDDGGTEWKHPGNITKLEEKVMTFKVGDKVKVKDSWFGHDGQVGVVLDTDNYGPYNYNIKFDTEGDNKRRDENFMGDSLELVTEEETTMKFKVGDKVKVKDSWFGFTGEVGLIVRIDGPAKYPYRVKFDVVDEEDEELFAEGSLELVKEKQSFTKSDLKTGMGVVLRDGSKGHVLIGIGLDDIIKDIEKSQWIKIEDYSEELTCREYQNLDIVEVYTTEYENKFLSDRMFDGKAVYVREEPKPEPEPTKMTMKEINEHFGKPIEIVE